MTTAKTWLYFTSALALLLTACPIELKGEDEPDGGTSNEKPPADGVDQNRDAKSISSDEAQRVCESVSAILTPAQRCTVGAVQATSSPEMCEQLKAQCIAHQGEQSEECNGAEIAADLSACVNVTIGEVKDCHSQVLTAQKSLTCADAGKRLAPPPCVQTLASRCPGLFDDRDGSAPDGGVRDAGYPYPGPVGGGGAYPGPDGGYPYPGSDGGYPYPGPDGGSQYPGPDGGSQYPGPDGGMPPFDPSECNVFSAGDSVPSQVDCTAFCAALTEPQCPQGPMAEQCQLGCESAKVQCPGTIGALSGCAAEAAADQRTWTCDPEGRPMIPGGCGLELRCFGFCLGVPMQQ